MAASLRAQHAENPEHRRPGPFTYGDYPWPDATEPALLTHKPIRADAVSRTDLSRIPEHGWETPVQREKPPVIGHGR